MSTATAEATRADADAAFRNTQAVMDGPPARVGAELHTEAAHEPLFSLPEPEAG
jgi:hypothetical protein